MKVENEVKNDNIFSVDDISFSNLDSISINQAEAFESRICEWSFVADAFVDRVIGLLQDGMSVFEAFSYLSDEIDIQSSSPKADTMDEALGLVNGFLSSLTMLDKVAFVDLIVSKMKSRKIHMDEADFLQNDAQSETFIYVKNSLSDEAYDVFSQEFEDPRVFYAQSFKEACRTVAEGRVGYAILPFEEKGGNRIPGIASMISQFDLKVVALTPVFGYEGTADVKYALVSRSFKIPKRTEDDDFYLEISASPNDDIGVTEFLYAAEKFGNSIYRINTLVSEALDKDAMSFNIVLRDSGEGFLQLLIFMTMFAGYYMPVGFYKNLE